MSYLFTSESVSEGHPDKVADQISDALLDEFLAYDKNSKVACETLVTTGQVVLAGEVKSRAYVDVQEVARGVIRKIGYTKSEYQFEAESCGVFSAIHEQSGDINRGVERENPYDQGAGDQGMMFGYATNETGNYMPLALDLSHALLISFLSIYQHYYLFSRKSSRISRIVLPVNGCLTSGATSAKGSMTNRRSCINGCGSVKRRVRMIRSSTIRRSMSITRS